MWPGFDGPHVYSREQFAAKIAALNYPGPTGWRPKGVVLHNTGKPDLAGWKESGPSHDARIANLLSYYEKQGWKHGPHWFISRTNISGFSNPLDRGTHSTCFNVTHFGLEMAGDFDTEAFDSGDGALVRDNAVFVIATLCRKFGFNPTDLKFHKDCPADHHDCPGKHVNKSAMIGLVSEAMSKMFGSQGQWAAGPQPGVITGPDGPNAAPLEPWAEIDWPISPMGTYRIAWIQDAISRLSPPELAIRVDGIIGVETTYAIRRFQHEQQMHVTGVAGPETVSVLKDLLNQKGT